MGTDDYKPRLIKLGRLYFKYIRNSELERQGLTALELARWMQGRGLIEIEGDQYRELTGQPNRRELRKLFQSKGAA